LIERIVGANDTHSFAILYDRYSNIVFNKCLSFAKSKEEAEDLTHDIFVLLFAKLRTYKGTSKFSSWLYAFVYNYCVNYVQRTLKKKNEKFVVSDEVHNYAEEEVLDEKIFELQADLLQASLKKLKPDDRRVLLMKYQDDMSVKDIMETLQLGASAVKMRLKRAKIKLINTYYS